MKKMFSQSKLTKKGLVEFFDKKGFYIVLILCVVIVGATALFVTTRNIGQVNGDFEAEKIIPEEIDGKTAIDASSKSVAQSSINSSQDSGVKSASDSNKVAVDTINDAKQAAAQSPKNTAPATNQKGTTQSKPSATSKPTAGSSFVLPVFGDVTFEYSQDKLAYSKTLGDWRTHSGMDIAAERGSQVKAAADGFVSEIKNDPRFGITIVLDHQNGLKTVYANLAGDDMVTMNQKIKQGDVIGSIGNTALFESAEAPHLHFEVWKNNSLVDPAAYLPNK